MLAAGRRVARWRSTRLPTPRCGSNSASRSAASRLSSTCVLQMLCRAEQADVAAADAAAPQPIPMAPFDRRGGGPRSIGIDAAKANAKDCIRCSVVHRLHLGAHCALYRAPGPRNRVGSSVDPGAGCVGLRR